METFKTKGVCARTIQYEIEDNKVRNLSFAGGCDGNLKAIGVLVEGMEVEEVIDKLEGITCGFKSTSCTDQLTQALSQHVNK